MKISPATDKVGDWWKTAVLYQIYPRSFQDSNGDGVGDLRGIFDRLPYIADLGFTAIWISPFFESPMQDFGYDVSNHRAIDPLFGSLDDFDALVERAHAVGLQVLIDLVLSHVSDQHAWFSASREARGAAYEECFVWADPAPDGGPPNNWLSVFGGPAWTFEPARNQYYLHNFLSSQPDLNYHNEVVQAEALDIAKFWLDRGVDGFRIDTVNFLFHDRQLRDNPKASKVDTESVTADNPYGHYEHVYDKNRPEVPLFLERFRGVLNRYGQKLALGEVGEGAEKAVKIMKSYQAPGRLHLSYTFDLLSDVFTAAHFRDFIINDVTVGGDLWRCLAFSNHDVMRSASRFSDASSTRVQIAKLSTALLLSLRGTPCVYQGEELGLTEADIPYERLQDPYGKHFWPEFKGRDGCRTPMPWNTDAEAGFTDEAVVPWLPIPAEHVATSVTAQCDDPDSPLAHIRHFLHVRRECGAFTSERMHLLDGPDGLLVFERGSGASSILCVFNLSAETLAYVLPTQWVDSIILLSAGSVMRDGTHERSTYAPWSYAIWSLGDRPGALVS